MPTIRKTLIEWLGHARRIAVLGVGSEIRGDDAAGLLIVKHLQDSLVSIPRERFAAFEGGTVPENLAGEIVRYAPSHVLIVDAADFGAGAGTVRVIERTRISAVSFSTHRLSLLMLTEYLECNTGCKTLVLGIQPKRIGVMEPMSKPVVKAVDGVSLIISVAIRGALDIKPSGKT